MDGASMVTSIISTMTSGISGIASGVGQGLSTLATSVFLTGTGESQTISMFGTLVVVFAAISLGLGLCRWMVNFVSSLGQRNR